MDGWYVDIKIDFKHFHLHFRELRDQGLTRPKVLILVPFRDCALRIVNLLIQLALPIDQKVRTPTLQYTTDLDIDIRLSFC